MLNYRVIILPLEGTIRAAQNIPRKSYKEACISCLLATADFNVSNREEFQVVKLLASVREVPGSNRGRVTICVKRFYCFTESPQTKS